MYNVRATLIGLGATFALVIMFLSIGDAIWHPTNGVISGDVEATRVALAKAPIIAMLYFVLNFGIAGFVGPFLARKMAGGISELPSQIVAVALVVASVVNAIETPLPIWVDVASALIIFPAAFLGMKLAAPKLVMSNSARG